MGCISLGFSHHVIGKHMYVSCNYCDDRARERERARGMIQSNFLLLSNLGRPIQEESAQVHFSFFSSVVFK